MLNKKILSLCMVSALALAFSSSFVYANENFGTNHSMSGDELVDFIQNQQNTLQEQLKDTLPQERGQFNKQMRPRHNNNIPSQRPVENNGHVHDNRRQMPAGNNRRWQDNHRQMPTGNNHRGQDNRRQMPMSNDLRWQDNRKQKPSGNKHR